MDREALLQAPDTHCRKPPSATSQKGLLWTNRPKEKAPREWRGHKNLLSLKEHYVSSGTFCDTSSFSWILLLSQGLFWSTVALEESYIKKHAGGFVCFNPSVSVLFCEFIFIVYPSELNTFAPVGCNFFNLWAKMCTTSGWSFLRCLCLVHKGVQWI